jgi:hypothetical protein
VQDAVVDAVAPAQHGQGGEEIDVRRRHLVVVTVSRHGVEAAMGDRPARFVVFHVLDEIEGMGAEELGPVGMGHRARLAPGLRHFGKDVGLRDAEAHFVRQDAVHLRWHAGVDGGIAAGRGRRQHGTHLPDLRLARLHPAFEIAEQPPPVAPGNAVEDDEEEFALHRMVSP